MMDLDSRLKNEIKKIIYINIDIKTAKRSFRNYFEGELWSSIRSKIKKFVKCCHKLELFFDYQIEADISNMKTHMDI